MDFDDVERRIEKIERRWRFVDAVLPTSLASRLVDIEWARKQRRQRENAKAAFQSQIDSLRELQADLESDISLLQERSNKDPETTIKKVSTRLDQAWELFEPYENIDSRHLRHDENNEVDKLRTTFSQVEEWLTAYEKVGKYADRAEQRLDNLEYRMKPYQDYGQYLTTPEQVALTEFAVEIDAILETAFEAAGDTPLANEYLDELSDFRTRMQAHRQFIRTYNEEFISWEADRYEELFTDIDEAGNDLSEEQKEAVLHDDKYNLVVAGAGSGKTVTLTHRIAYLTQRRNSVPPERILAISYTNNAASVMESRLESSFGIHGVNATTFHSLGKRILETEWETKPEVFLGHDRRNFVEDMISRETSRANSDFKRQYFQFLKHFYDDIETQVEFEEKEESIEDIVDDAHVTLKQERVRSRSEKTIADFLFLHQVEYTYQSLQEWVEEVPGRGAYRADFYLPEYETIISHRPLHADGTVMGWSSATSYEDVTTTVQWERKRFDEADDYELIETYEFEAGADRLRRALRARLVDAGVILDEMNYGEFIESAFEYAEHESRIFKLFSSFIENARQLNLSPEELEARIPDGPPKEKAFGKCGLDLYQKYCAHLQANDYIDFSGMLYQAIEATQSDRKKYLNQYDQILVDEFQDISKAQVELLKCFVGPENDTKLFAVGDDWQSIYSFSGSEVDYFINFDEYFDTSQVTELTKNYRCPASVVEAGNDLIDNNERQIKKEAIPTSGKDTNIKLHGLDTSPDAWKYETELCEYVVDMIEQYLAAGAPPEEIMVLARSNNFYYALEEACDDNGIKASMSPEDEAKPDEFVRLYSVHKSKGDEADHVIIIHAVEDIIGFPSQVEDDELLEPVRIAPKENMAEERRLFYVALTRSSGTLDIVTSEGHRSRFIDEIDHQLSPACNLAMLNGDKRRTNLNRVWLQRSFGSGNAQTQAGIVADGFGTSRFVIWEDNSHDQLDEGCVYSIEHARVEYNDYNEEYEIQIDQNTEVTVVDVREDSQAV